MACIQKCKSVIDDKRGNALDRIDISKLSCSDASKIIGGLLALIKCNKAASNGRRVSNSPAFMGALDDIYDTIEKYQK